MNDIGMGIAEAALNGFRLGKRIQQEQALQSWQEYAAELERHLNEMRQRLADTNVEVDKYRCFYSISQERLNASHEKNIEFERFIAEQNKRFEAVMSAHHGCLDTFQKSLAEKDQEIKYWKRAAEDKNRSNDTLTSILRNVSAKAAALDRLYEILVEEVSRIYGADRFESLNSEKIGREVENARIKFEETGKLSYAPKVDAIRKQIRLNWK
ncbi:MAG: hypothetical protein ACXVH6_03845 [Halobacteriota archaeon]